MRPKGLYIQTPVLKTSEALDPYLRVFTRGIRLDELMHGAGIGFEKWTDQWALSDAFFSEGCICRVGFDIFFLTNYVHERNFQHTL